MCNGKCLDLSFAATESEASAGIAQLSRCLAGQGLPAHKAGDVKIALAEAINNVVEHAYADVTPAKVKVRCRLHRNWLEILISDTGESVAGISCSRRCTRAAGFICRRVARRGFGWFLIHELTSDIHYERCDGCNRLSLRFDFPEPA